MANAARFLKIDDVFGEFVDYKHKKVVDIREDVAEPICVVCTFRPKCRLQNPHLQDTHDPLHTRCVSPNY